MNIVYHYPGGPPPASYRRNPLLCRSKRGVLTFFTSAGVRASFLADRDKRLREEPDKINKHKSQGNCGKPNFRPIRIRYGNERPS